jgi:hypothetical protein
VVDVLIRQAVIEDAQELYANMRQNDLDECNALGPHDIQRSIERSIRSSTLCWSLIIDGKLAAVFGVGVISVLTGIGSPWLLGTSVLDRHPRVLVRNTAPYIGAILRAFPHLINFVHARNTRSVHWLRRLGFTLHPPEPYGELGELFHRFEMRA